MSVSLRVAYRWCCKQAGLVDPPPHTVQEITAWVLSYVARDYSQSAQAYYETSNRHPDMTPFAKAVQQQLDLGEQKASRDDLDGALLHVHNAWTALNQKPKGALRQLLEAKISERAAQPYAYLGSPAFKSKPLVKQIKNIRWVISGLYNALALFMKEIGLDQNLTGWELTLEQQQRLFAAYQGQSASKRNDQRFKINATGWKYKDLPGMDALIRTGSILVKVAPDSYGKATAAWDSQKGQMFLNYPAYGSVEKNTRALQAVFTDLENGVFHECIHMTQYLFKLLGFTGGMPSRKESPYKQDFGRYEDEVNWSTEERKVRQRLRSEGVDLKDVSFHSLDDVEFYTNLADAIREFKRKFKGGDLNSQITKFIRGNEFFRSLQAVSDQRHKFKKSVKLLWSSMQTS